MARKKKKLQYLMPAEWEKHEGTWLAWPHNENHWPGKFSPIPKTYVEIVRALVLSEKVFICVNNQDMEREVRLLLETGGVETERVFFFPIPTNASWSRDHGPTFVAGPDGATILDWQYNANGQKWGPCDLDDRVPTKIAEILKLPVVEPGIILEGGSIDVNGQGTLLTTKSCLLNKNRNPHLSRSQIENYLKSYLGAENILWLAQGIAGDDTDGHIDDLARFVNPTTVVCAFEEKTDDENYQILKKNYDDLREMKDQDGNYLNVVVLPMPGEIKFNNQRLPASYANFYIANTVVLVPLFGCVNDEKALKIFKDLFPARKIIGINCLDLVWGFGTIHCSTQQQPKFTKPKKI